MKYQGSIEKRIFSFYLQRKKKVGINFFPNQFTLGDYDPRLIEAGESLVYCKVTHELRWAVDVSSIYLQKDSEQNNIFVSTSTKALIDSGTSLIAVSETIRDKLYHSLQSEGKGCRLYLGFIICKERNLANYPDIVFNLCGNKMALNPIDYIEIYDDFLLIFIQIYNGNEELIILGDTFMRKYYTVFNLEEKKVGFALANPGLDKLIKWDWNIGSRLIFYILIKLLLFLLIIF